MYDEIRNRVLTILKNKPQSFRSVAHEIGIAFATLNMFLHTKRRPFPYTMLKIANWIDKKESDGKTT